jgi:putative phosphoribosyl transferase
MATRIERAYQVEIPSGRKRLSGFLRVPPGARGVIAFAHGSGSGRFSPRNQYVAHALEAGGLATLLLDLLTVQEADDRSKVFDIELLAERLQSASAWLGQQPQTKALPLGYFGASTGAGAALIAAARDPSAAKAIVSRGGRPDLAGTYLASVQAPTLLIVGGNDEIVIELNKKALRLLHCPKQLIVVPGATHLFEEEGTLEEVARLAGDWFGRKLGDADTSQQPPNPGGRCPNKAIDELCQSRQEDRQLHDTMNLCRFPSGESHVSES